eukprot:7369827-Ditylum_brightwellii.AAC.1
MGPNVTRSTCIATDLRGTSPLSSNIRRDWEVRAGQWGRDTAVTLSTDHAADPVSEQLWGTVQNAIAYSSKIMAPLLAMIGVSNKEKSPFCCEFVTCKDLCNAFVKYCPTIFKYNGCTGEGVNDTMVTSMKTIA